MPATAPADAAFQAALTEIDRVRAAGKTRISFGREDFRPLTTIPDTLRDIPSLIFVDLDHTQVADLSPLRDLTGLRGLSLNQTAVADLSPLRGLTGLQGLSLNQTVVADLVPLRDLTELKLLSLSQTAVADLSPLRGLTGLQVLALSQTAVADLAPLRELTGLQTLSLIQTAVADLAPLRDLTGLQTLYLSQTAVADLSPLRGLTGLQGLYFSQTAVADLSPLRDLTGLRVLSLNQTAVVDMRPICLLERLGEPPTGNLMFFGTPALKADPELARLSAIEDDQDRTRQTLTYLRSLAPWPEPLPWLIPKEPPLPEPSGALPMRRTEDGIDLVTPPITEDEIDDPIRPVLHEALTRQTNDLIRVSANLDEGAYAEACRLRDMLADGLAAMNPLRVHLAIEALRRIHAEAPQGRDADLVRALAAVIETGPGLTLDTAPVQLFIDRARRNRLERLDEANVDAQIRLAQGIAKGDITAEMLARLADRAASGNADDQFTAIRPTLNRNFVIEAGKYAGAAIVGAASGAVADASVLQVYEWLAANASEIRLLAAGWGEPFLVWITPILERAEVAVATARRTTDRLLRKQ